MTAKIQSIETVWNGIRFRSRLEARYAALFTALGIRWEYEPQAFDLVSTCYLPDFRLPDAPIWVEIKPLVPTVEERRKLELLVDQTRSKGIILAGPPYPGAFDVYGFFFRPSEMRMDANKRLQAVADVVHKVGFVGKGTFAHCNECGGLNIVELIGDERLRPNTSLLQQRRGAIFLNTEHAKHLRRPHVAHRLDRVMQATAEVKAIRFDEVN